MTIAVSLKVNDGVVLAADSATTFAVLGGGVANVYNNANKIFNLHKQLPIGAMTWGQANIGPASIATLMKDLRWLLQGEDLSKDWKLDAASYSIKSVAEQVVEFMDEHISESPILGSLGLLVAGYSSGAKHAEEYLLTFEPGQQTKIEPLHEGENTGASWYGNPEPISRILNGFSMGLGNALANLGVPPNDLDRAVSAIQTQLQVPFLLPAMPLQDAIDLAEWLVDLTAKYVRFAPGADTVGGPIEVAGITRHEGFKWIRRKHYFSSQLNPTSER